MISFKLAATLSRLDVYLLTPGGALDAALLATSLIIAAAVAHRLRHVAAAQEAPSSTAVRIGRGGLRRLIFPMLALALVTGCRVAVAGYSPAHLLALAVPLLLAFAVIRLLAYGLRALFPALPWLKALERSLALVVWLVVALHISGLLDGVIDALEQSALVLGRTRISVWALLWGSVTVAAALLIALWIGRVLETRLMASETLDSSLQVVLSRAARALLLVVGGLVSLQMVGVDLTTLHVFGGALGVGLGLGLQKIASNYVSGFIILLDRSIRIGNMIAVDNHRGQVTRITTRYTVLRGLNGVEHIVPNEVLVGSVVLNESYSDPRVWVGLKVQVSYGSDVPAVLRILEDAARAHPRVLAVPPPRGYLAAFADSGIDLEVGFWIADPQEGTQNVRSDISLAIWQAFRNAGVEIPYPQREVRIVSPATAAASS